MLGVDPELGEINDVVVEADVVANGLGLSVEKLQTEMRTGRVTSRSERGVGEDQGRFRLTFSYDHRQFQLITDAKGHVIKSSSINFGKR